MDQTPEFIKMCRELPYTFAPNREYEYGDYVHDRYLNKTYVVADGGADKTPATHNCIRADSGSITDCFWLPKQDQLQNIIIDKWAASYENKGLGFQTTFNTLLNKTKNTIEYYWKFKSLEQLWLAFVMHEKFNMIWTNSEWILSS